MRCSLSSSSASPSTLRPRRRSWQIRSKACNRQNKSGHLRDRWSAIRFAQKLLGQPVEGGLPKNACRGEHCSPVPVCLARSFPRKCVAAASRRATNGRPDTREEARMQFPDGLEGSRPLPANRPIKGLSPVHVAGRACPAPTALPIPQKYALIWNLSCLRWPLPPSDAHG